LSKEFSRQKLQDIEAEDIQTIANKHSNDLRKTQTQLVQVLSPKCLFSFSFETKSFFLAYTF